MKNQTRSLNLCAVVLCLCTITIAQQNESKTRKTFRVAGKVTSILVKATARATFEAAKFAGKNVIVPAVKSVGVPMAKAAPPLIAKAVKLTAKGVEKGVELVKRGHDVDKTADHSSNASTN